MKHKGKFMSLFHTEMVHYLSRCGKKIPGKASYSFCKHGSCLHVSCLDPRLNLDLKEWSKSQTMWVSQTQLLFCGCTQGTSEEWALSYLLTTVTQPTSWRRWGKDKSFWLVSWNWQIKPIFFPLHLSKQSSFNHACWIFNSCSLPADPDLYKT